MDKEFSAFSSTHFVPSHAHQPAISSSQYFRKICRGEQKEHGDFTSLPKADELSSKVQLAERAAALPSSLAAEARAPRGLLDRQPKEKGNTSSLKRDQKRQSPPFEDFTSKPHSPYLSPLHLEIQAPN